MLRIIEEYSRILIIIITIFLKPISTCQATNPALEHCLHVYMERDFIIVQELLERPPYGENGHLLIEEADLESICERFGQMKKCYESQFPTCNTFSQYSHLVRIVRLLQNLDTQFCSPGLQGLRDLIHGGYCIEFVRKESVCQATKNAEQFYNITGNATLNFDIKLLHSYPIKQQWPYMIYSIMKFESGHEICDYLQQFQTCLTPYIEGRCHDASQKVWNQSLILLNQVWCNSSPILQNLSSIIFLTILNIYFAIKT